MKISEIYKHKKQPISFEIFPPKGNLDLDGVRKIIDQLKALSPDFISITYSAGGGGNSDKTVEIASLIKNEYGIETMAHLTCINSNIAEVERVSKALKDNNIENVLALRGDRQDGQNPTDFHYASDLILELKNKDFCIGAACYPEGHVNCESFDEDIKHLKEKEDVGAKFFISQLFFDNEYFYRFLGKARTAGIKNPISAGVMPILSKNQVSRMIFMCGSSLPSAIVRLLNKYENNEDDLRKAGIEYAANQILDLLKNSGCGVHIYTMNHPDIAERQLVYMKEKGYERI